MSDETLGGIKTSPDIDRWRDMQIWRNMSPASLNAAYDNFGAVPDALTRLARWSSLSADLRQDPSATLGLRYGSRQRQAIDMFSCGASDAPLLAFIHGGYWQRNAKEDFSCMSLGPLARGIDVALIGYTLAPDASITAIVGEIMDALAFLRAHRPDGRLIVSGWSAGGHLAAMMMDALCIDGVLAISGIFDLAPICGTVLNDKLNLTDDELDNFSPIRRLPRSKTPLAIAYGIDELPELRRQSIDYHRVLQDYGFEARLMPIADTDHFSILETLIMPNGVLTEAVVQLADVL